MQKLRLLYGYLQKFCFSLTPHLLFRNTAIYWYYNLFVIRNRIVKGLDWDLDKVLRVSFTNWTRDLDVDSKKPVCRLMELREN